MTDTAHRPATKRFSSLLLGGLLSAFVVYSLHLAQRHESIIPSAFPPQAAPDLLTQVRDTGTLVVATRSSPTTFYMDQNGPAGYEFELASALAEHLGVELEFSLADSIPELFAMMDSGAADLAAAALTVTEERRTQYRFSKSYQSSGELVIYRAGSHRPRDIEDLLGAPMTVTAGSSAAETLRKHQQQYPDLSWMEAPVSHPLGLLEGVSKGDIRYTIVDSNTFLTSHGLFPRLRVGFELTASRPIAWITSTHQRSLSLSVAVDAFLSKFESTGQLAVLDERHYGHTPEINSHGLVTLTRYMDDRLPRYQDLIQRVASEENIDWRLLAAISYQESHWNPRAVSPTGVRGMMMLTQPTAMEMGVRDRVDAEQSLRGAVRYFNKILARIPRRISGPDRTWMALAAYNVGLGHLEDARLITQRQGGNPDAWAEVVRHLPLLSKERWHAQTRYGFARGHEPVDYVSNIRRYYNILSMNDLARSLQERDALQLSLVTVDGGSKPANSYL